MLTATGEETFYASRDTTIEDEFVCEDGTLTIQGQYLGTIAALGDPIPPMTQRQNSTTGHYSFRKMLNFIPLWSPFSSPGEKQ